MQFWRQHWQPNINFFVANLENLAEKQQIIHNLTFNVTVRKDLLQKESILIVQCKLRILSLDPHDAEKLPSHRNF